MTPEERFWLAVEDLYISLNMMSCLASDSELYLWHERRASYLEGLLKGGLAGGGEQNGKKGFP